MPWTHDEDSRRKDAEVYGGKEWQRVRKAALRRAGGKCEKCSSSLRLQVDHVIPVSQGGGNEPGNVQVLCEVCHKRKTATEGGWRNRKPHDPKPRPRTKW